MASGSSHFRPYNESPIAHNDPCHVQAVQAEHSTRLPRLESKLEDNARMKSGWGGASPFPSALGNTPQHTPLPQSSHHFKPFDDDGTNIMSALQLDSEEEPRRLGPASRANSVRFDESANHGHWAHATRSSIDFAPKLPLGGLTMHERSSSHKSEGRASSVHSVRSAASGRASSITLDNGFGLGDSARSPIGTPVLAPGLLVLGTVPAIIRCWINTDFKHDALLYAAICTGSHGSFIDLSLLQSLGLTNHVDTSDDGSSTISLAVYLPEAIPHSRSSSRSASPTPQLPTITVSFQVLDTSTNDAHPKAIRIVIGSDALRLHSADILFSNNAISLYDDDRCKMSVPMVRPEEERVFKTLQTTTRSGNLKQQTPATPSSLQSLNGLGQSEKLLALTRNDPAAFDKYRPPAYMSIESDQLDDVRRESIDQPTSRTTSRPTTPYKPVGFSSRPKTEEDNDAVEDEGQTRNTTRTSSSIAARGNWRQDANGNGHSTASNTTAPTNAGVSSGTSASQFDWANRIKDLSNQTQKRDGGIKVLRPMKSSTNRTISSSAASPGPLSPPLSDASRSRFFDEGKRRANNEPRTPFSEAAPVSGTSLGTSDGEGGASATTGAASGSSNRNRANPVGGGGSAFAWLNPSGGSK